MPDPSPPRPVKQHCSVVDEKIVGLGFFKLNFIGALRDHDNEINCICHFLIEEKVVILTASSVSKIFH